MTIGKSRREIAGQLGFGAVVAVAATCRRRELLIV
jgi:hypothetical protein